MIRLDWRGLATAAEVFWVAAEARENKGKTLSTSKIGICPERHPC